MSRIDQALQKAGMAARKPRTLGDDQTFVSPWEASENRDAPEREASIAPAPAQPSNGETVERLLVKKEMPSLELGSAWRERRVTSPDADPALVEQFRRLAAVMQHAQASSGVRVLMLTSVEPGDGKTLTALNLSLVLSESYSRRVLLVDADLRRPSLGRMLELADVPGLGDALKAQTEQKLSVIEVTPTFTLLPGGQPDPDPMSRLTSERMRHILSEAGERFDWVILDAPPMGPTADAQFLAELVDGVIFVIRAGRTQHADVDKAIKTLGRERILGVILNGVDEMPSGSYEYVAGNHLSGGK